MKQVLVLHLRFDNLCDLLACLADLVVEGNPGLTAVWILNGDTGVEPLAGDYPGDTTCPTC